MFVCAPPQVTCCVCALRLEPVPSKVPLWGELWSAPFSPLHLQGGPCEPLLWSWRRGSGGPCWGDCSALSARTGGCSPWYSRLPLQLWDLHPMSALRQEGYSVPAAPGGCGEGPLWAAPTGGDAVITRRQGRKQATSRLFSQIVASRFQRLTPGGGEPHAPVLDSPSPRLRFTRRKPCC